VQLQKYVQPISRAMSMSDCEGHLHDQIEEIIGESDWCTPEFFNCCSWG